MNENNEERKKKDRDNYGKEKLRWKWNRKIRRKNVGKNGRKKEERQQYSFVSKVLAIQIAFSTVPV
jgi:hypothetical protein